MSPSPGRSKILIGPATLLKELTWSGEGPSEFIGSRKADVHAVPVEQWYPQSGIDAGFSYAVPGSGVYTLEFWVRQPDFSNGGGFGHGWSGTYGGGSAWMRTIRSGSTLEDNIGLQSIGGGAGSGNNQFHCGPVNRSLLAGDKVEFWTSTGGATGTGVRNWDVVCLMTKLRG